MSVWLALGALLADRLLGELPRWHPLVGFGRLADWAERRFNKRVDARFNGVLAVVVTVLPFTLLTWLLEIYLGGLVGLVLLYVALGARSLEEHAMAVASELAQGNLQGARTQVSLMVSRESAGMDEDAVTRATIESVLENGVDAVFGALFWFLIPGAPGVVLYRLVNTLDAMWDYRTERFNSFGWFAARLDDLLNWIPACLTAFSYALVGNCSQAMDCWRDQAQLLASPNDGPAMTAGADALGVELGGPAVYGGEQVDKAVFGVGDNPGVSDIYCALDLVHKGLFLWLAVVFMGSLLIA
ncbi:adenosylcobinamide-phosphate synthase CbiB [Solemya velesiana gill symbiont]|uniref:Cobalamin biosynthesis protein CobD n=1 Tax=Solemya velesiana gill symbiont TaxID=1918948 RepID=A0A1T2KT77_9GAMM|nr:adenosylcobinamide-phosphate synthase CbiB [Solemya velesiana gill symbiont]OOZ36059.1 cobalamin biosynthesis protein [Solemya velesiana gill symbiont]